MVCRAGAVLEIDTERPDNMKLTTAFRTGESQDFDIANLFMRCNDPQMHPYPAPTVGDFGGERLRSRIVFQLCASSLLTLHVPEVNQDCVGKAKLILPPRVISFLTKRKPRDHSLVWH